MLQVATIQLWVKQVVSEVFIKSEVTLNDKVALNVDVMNYEVIN